MPDALLAIDDVAAHFPVRRGFLRRAVGAVRAVDGVSLEIAAGETLGLVGESGCGKSTLGRLVARLLRPTAGRITLGGRDITGLSRRELRPVRRDVQIVFQDPVAALNPRFTAGDIVAEPLVVHGIGDRRERRARVAALFEQVGLRPDQIDLHPHQFSGGQRQRIGIARALALSPKLIVLDEPVSALDVSIQAQIVNLLMDVQQRTGVAYLFISHDLGVVEHVSKRIAVMYLGAIVELGEARGLFDAPSHPYTQALLRSIPLADPAQRQARRAVLPGELPSPLNPPSGCRFHTRCPEAVARCRSETPVLKALADGRHVACHLR